VISVTRDFSGIAEYKIVETPAPYQRRTPRYKLDLRAKIVYRRNGLNQSALARGQDVSEGGMSMFVPIEFRKDDALEVEFTLPHSRLPLRVHAVVRNTEGHRYGVEFLNVSDAQKQEITRMCEAMVRA
jgi:c-di-GMP-binding flagellar brake protein YcgR